MDNNKNRVNYSLSNIDIAMYLDNPNIVKYGDLAQFDSIDQVFDGYSYVIVLIKTSTSSGHWISLLRYNNCVEQFDSYGGTIDHELSYISKQMKAKLGETDHFLTRLLKNSDYKIVVNKYKFQAEAESVDTCGRHVLLRIIMFICGGMHLDEYIKWFKTSVRKLKLSNDLLVVKLITFQ